MLAGGSSGNATHSTVYIPVVSPPTPAPSPGPPNDGHLPMMLPSPETSLPLAMGLPQNPFLRRQYLTALLQTCTPSELLFISTTIAPLLKRDFLYSLPPELALQVLSFISRPKTLVRAMRVSKYWYKLVGDESVWRRMCLIHNVPLPFEDDGSSTFPGPWSSPSPTFSYRDHFKYHYTVGMNWKYGGRLLRSHRVPAVNNNPESCVVTSISLDKDWVVVGLANSRVHLFRASTGVLARSLVGHELGVWAVALVSAGGKWKNGRRQKQRSTTEDEALSDIVEELDICGGSPKIPAAVRTALGLDVEDDELLDEDCEDAHAVPGRPSYATGATDGWGQPNSLVVSGGCDKVIRVWDTMTGYCAHVLQGHTSTVRCIKVLHNRPIAVSGSRDSTLRVWDIQKGKMLRVLAGHTQSVRCLDVCGNRVVSGSYDFTCRLWDIDTGECLHVLRGHFHQIYSVGFDGVRIASGGLDTTVRLWDAQTGDCLAVLSGHTALVCQLQLSSTRLATGGSDGRVITFSLKDKTYPIVHRISVHGSSVTALQFDRDFLVTGGNDGRVYLFDSRTGEQMRELCEPCDCVWKVVFTSDTYAVMCRRAGKTVMEIWTLKPKEIGEITS
ncbi:WD40 repeat-like protein [Cylindrobasidium torrendii FP15055 ss-10]|uniref:WD40 repeat-like protein n=1 Tax=Cylindrobasidium torrendii FP15055 ss-10 TaxID=1314674 RepID=A0A0D7BNT6_9AGAR|nr:WD40 repeat-like protein [Cylindrobasidium torrendii FP15055 ss-10]